MDEKSENYLDNLVEDIGFVIKKVIKRGATNSQYSIVLPNDQEILIGDAGSLLSPLIFRRRVFAAAGIIVPKLSKGTWFRICEDLAGEAELRM